MSIAVRRARSEFAIKVTGKVKTGPSQDSVALNFANHVDPDGSDSLYTNQPRRDRHIQIRKKMCTLQNLHRLANQLS